MTPDSLSRRQLLTLTGSAAAAAALASLSLTGCSDRYKLRCQHQRTGEVYRELNIEIGSVITHSWIHSIELSRWTDIYRFDGETLMLTSTEFEAYGAGMPLDEGDVSVQDGQVVIENIDREFEAIRWIHSHRVDYRIGVDGDESLIDTDALPDLEPLELRPK
ncbi:DUF1850 domain-containing protein [Nesterenkonia sp. MY13]|uniref:DUF1850 domain-containing protein n=1 Tax=Nesterenkonia sedimenti TaxID=1463632 RepID=A0A7X8TJ79_9MICC|nr:DUF1850 domain-containing protein [Nesterenkonia sedimenti]NLS09574.1 DUF1850 domain-containing protein [Nesterenkonia sedimenti]